MFMKRSYAIFKKQLKDTLKNKSVLIQFIMFPLMTVIMSQAISVEGIGKDYFVNLFATMYIGMAPMTCMASIMSEEKENNTLRVLMMSNVKPYEYLSGVGSYVFMLCMLGNLVFAACSQHRGKDIVVFLATLAIGVLVSLMLGAAIGTWSKNQMTATSVTVPVMFIFSFLPMLAMFNDKIAIVSKFTYSQQLSDMINSVGQMTLGFENVAVILGNMILALGLFTLCYRKSGLA